MKKFTKVLATAIAVVTASIFLTGCGSGSAGNTVNAAAKDGAADSAGDDSKAAGAKKGTLTVSIGADWFPFLFIDEDDNLAGYDVDVINAVAENIGYDVEFDIATSIWEQFWIKYAEEHPEQNLTLEKINGTPYDEVNIEAVKNGTIAAFINTKVAIEQVNQQYGEVYKLIGNPVISNPVFS